MSGGKNDFWPRADVHGPRVLGQAARLTVESDFLSFEPTVVKSYSRFRRFHLLKPAILLEVSPRGPDVGRVPARKSRRCVPSIIRPKTTTKNT